MGGRHGSAWFFPIVSPQCHLLSSVGQLMRRNSGEAEFMMSHLGISNSNANTRPPQGMFTYAVLSVMKLAFILF